jgi:hypothetical protein
MDDPEFATLTLLASITAEPAEPIIGASGRFTVMP